MKKLFCFSLAAIMMLASCNGTTADPSVSEESATTAGTVAETVLKDPDVYTITSDFPMEKSAKTTFDDIKEIIALAEEVYDSYKYVIIDDDTTITTIDRSSISKHDQKTPFTVSGHIRKIIIAMISQRLPENYIRLHDPNLSFPYPDYYFLNLEEKGIADADAAFEKMKEDGTIDFDQIADCVYLLRGALCYYDSATDEYSQIYPVSYEDGSSSAATE